MAAQKRTLEDSTSTLKAKKPRTEIDKGKGKIRTSTTGQASHALPTEEVDFPRGGGTSFTPLEVKAIRAEAVKEANAELFKEDISKKSKTKKKKNVDAVASSSTNATEGKDRIRIEHLNYKRVNIGMKIFGQIVHILPLALVVSLPNQLYGHVPITNISSQFTDLLERMDAQDLPSEAEEEEEEDTEDTKMRSAVPELSDIFHVGQYVRAVVSAVHLPGTTDVSGVGKARDEVSRASRRVELALLPDRVNSGVQKSDLKAGFTLTGAIKSREDHGYIMDFGIQEVSGFLSFKDASRGGAVDGTRLYTSSILDVIITKVSANGRTCAVSTDPSSFTSSHLSEISSVTSVLPGTLVQGLITNVHNTGLNLQVLGFFDGTIDQFHLDKAGSSYKVGKKVKARVLYDHSSSPPKFALSLADHIIKLGSRLKKIGNGQLVSLGEAFPIGTILEAAKVLRVESERGLIAEIEPGVEGFVHISHTSDDHVPSLSSIGSWKPGSLHPARITGYFAFDGLLQLSMKPSIIQQKYLQVTDVAVGEIIKGTIKKLTDNCLIVSLSGGVDGIVWPNHYADIMLKHPAKRFKEGASIKCKVLGVDAERKRIVLSAKKTLLDSTLPILSTPEDVKQGIVTHAVVFRTHEKHLMVEFFNNMKAIVPAKEIGELPKSRLYEAFPVGKVVKIRIISAEDGRITASIKQAAPSFDIITDISSIEIGNSVEGKIAELHKDNVLITLEPTKIRALLSLKNLANHRSQTVAQLKAGLQVGESLDELVVVSRNPEKSLVLVANKPKAKPTLAKGSNITLESVTIGLLVGGRVTRLTRSGALVKITSQIGGILHFTDIADDFDAGGSQLPGVDSIIRAVVVGIDKDKRQLTLSTRRSRMKPDEKQAVVDREIKSLGDLEVGQTVRGFVKNIIDHGLFVTIGRDIDARVQIRELFDEFVKEWQGRFQEHQVVKGRILSVNLETKKVEMSFRSKDLAQKQSSTITINDLREGRKVDGLVKRVEDYGLFIQIVGSKLSGLCHKSQLSDNTEADVSIALKGFREGDTVKAMVLGVENKRIALSLKPSHFNEEDFADEEDESITRNEEQEEDDIQGGDDGDVLSNGPQDIEMPLDAEDESEEEMEIDVDGIQLEYQPQAAALKKASSTQGPTLAGIGGFQWPSNPIEEVDQGVDSSSDEEENDKPLKKRRKRKEIEQDLTADMHTKTPESNADFERLLLGSPNSSYLWIQYMSFQLPLSEVDKAREIAHRAIKTINFREEQERMNVWIALLNLENVYGTDETLDSVFKEAARANDSKTIHLRLATIFEQSEKQEKAEEQYKRTSKKFGQSSKVWTLFGQFLLKRGDVEEARKLLPRSLQSLEKRKHLKTICQFAQLEYKHGDPERGKTLFEGIVDSHPKRWDMWSIYMDMETTQRNVQGLRNLFDRVFTLKMTSHKAKAFFKKWLELEKRLGDEEGTENVKNKAIEWTQRAASNES
ncbi:hypothetical protein CPB83DRAFT_376457 [Crepidotus variabilis]|uniref:S1 motif domain-containing protein n=1 Tax=Crepidotus variabilis TaxID=179855 RepID=A0A9P6EES8_9AGAR|nr:hypothetical protein CPB83DRAFT_376457 [Crepidotus variabilis]